MSAKFITVQSQCVILASVLLLALSAVLVSAVPIIDVAASSGKSFGSANSSEEILSSEETNSTTNGTRKDL